MAGAAAATTFSAAAGAAAGAGSLSELLSESLDMPAKADACNHAQRHSFGAR